MELPESFRKPLEYISRNVLFEQTHSFIPENDTFMPHGKEIQHAANGQISVSRMSRWNKGWFAVVVVDASVAVVHPVNVCQTVLFFLKNYR